jgi:Arc/MetJ-type ribon-helix-helix transcriptional regulator
MVKTLEQAIAQISKLPDADQEQIGRKLLSHVDRLNALRAEIDKGLNSLDLGQGAAVNIDEFLSRKNARHGGA